jgi:hypothetical protein
VDYLPGSEAPEDGVYEQLDIFASAKSARSRTVGVLGDDRGPGRRRRLVAGAAADMIEGHAILMARWREAEQRLAVEGVVIVAPTSGVPAINPWHSVARVAAAEAQRIERSLPWRRCAAAAPAVPRARCWPMASQHRRPRSIACSPWPRIVGYGAGRPTLGASRKAAPKTEPTLAEQVSRTRAPPNRQ